jgi:glycosyltransferase involved in cell wall biosynthesis
MRPIEISKNCQPWVLQFCHGYDSPFLDCARQYAVLFEGTEYKVCTVYLTGVPSEEVVLGSASDEVIFLGYDSKDIRGLKLGAMRKLKGIVAERDFRLCIAHRFKPIYIALLATKLPVIGIHHAFGVYKRRMRRWFVNHFRSRLLLLGVSNAVRDEIRKYLPAWPAQQIDTFYNRIDVPAVQAEQIPREAARNILGLPQDAWVIGNVGRLHPDKDQATLIRGFAHALPMLPTSSILAIMGSGDLEAILKALAADLHIVEKVIFLGQVPQARRYFKAFDIFALTSDHEPFGMVLLEAMAAGVPIICSDCGGGQEVIDSEGKLFPLGNTSALAQCMAYASKAGVTAASERLQNHFSDTAAKKRFRDLHNFFCL